jgi:hypothetical protein
LTLARGYLGTNEELAVESLVLLFQLDDSFLAYVN